MDHSLFILPITKEHFGCFHVLAIMHKAAYKHSSAVMCRHKFSTYLGKCQGDLLDYMVRLSTVWKKLPTCLPHYYHFYSHYNESSCCSAFSPAVGIISFLDYSHSNRCVEVFHHCLHPHHFAIFHLSFMSCHDSGEPHHLKSYEKV